ncbi:flagellar hook-associated protein FlgK [Geovibrio thiophilus]|uniref:Flagellar hook-associated protein 1 n=1 Tax=Geovibrio thiophilus TaxID=139438 RepID=A0A3R5XVN1_9BACT|nr:flagellar hook-associated protein FlgK [Geovibrio thiophilus]QAR32246.1 flagellar hook-associated protein FlgK [Geovibrio thiophilus]
MSNIFGIFNSGVSGLMASQAGIDVTGHNIANVNTAGYSRQTVSLTTQTPNISGSQVYGRGVQITSITRVYDEILAESIRNEESQLSFYSSVQTTLSKVTIYFNELEEGSGLGESLRDYFNAWSDFSNNPTDQSEEAMAKRVTLVETTNTLTQKIQSSYNQLESFRDESDYNISAYVSEINQLSEALAKINGEIAKIESVGSTANDYRDQRDQILARLSEIANVTVNEKDNGQVTVYLGGSALVDDKVSYKLFAESDNENDGHYKITWGTSIDSKGQTELTQYITGGAMGAELITRDEILTDYMGQLDELAVTLINETNRIHSLGQGVNRFTQITSTNGVANPSFVFSQEAGSFPAAEITKGTVRVTVYDSDGAVAGTYDIDIDPDKDNLNSVIQKISGADGDMTGGKLQASIALDNSIKISTEAGYTFAFTEDTSNFLVAAGLNSYFSGTGAGDIQLSSQIQENNLYIAAGTSGAEGDNTVAKALADLKYEDVFEDKGITIDGFYSYFVATIASEKSQVDTFVTTITYSLSELQLKMEEIQGVSMDEELTNLMKFQRSYEASARFITTVDSMIDKLINGTGLVGR